MNHTFKVLRSDAEFLAAAMSQVRVYVVSPLNDDMIEIIDYGGPVEKYTPHSVKINGSYFFRNQYEFRTDVRSSAG